MSRAIESFLTQVREDLGVQEVPRGSNMGPRVNQMLRTTGLGPGYFWCAAAVATWGQEALGQAWPLPLSADCDVLLFFARKRGILKTAPQVGDVFLRLANENDATHTGVVTGVDANSFKTIEGNSNDEGDRNGYEVCALDREFSSRYRFIRWADLVSFGDAKAIGAYQWSCKIGEKSLDMLSEKGVGWVPLRPLMTALYGAETVTRLGWSKIEAGPTWDGDPLPFRARLISGDSWVPLRAAADWQGCDVNADNATRTATLVRRA